MVLEAEGTVPFLGTVYQERTDDTAGQDLGKQIQHVPGREGDGVCRTAVTHPLPLLFHGQDPLGDVLLQLLSQGGFVQCHGRLKGSKILHVYDL